MKLAIEGEINPVLIDSSWQSFARDNILIPPLKPFFSIILHIQAPNS